MKIVVVPKKFKSIHLRFGILQYMQYVPCTRTALPALYIKVSSVVTIRMSIVNTYFCS